MPMSLYMHQVERFEDTAHSSVPRTGLKDFLSITHRPGLAQAHVYIFCNIPFTHFTMLLGHSCFDPSCMLQTCLKLMHSHLILYNITLYPLLLNFPPISKMVAVPSLEYQDLDYYESHESRLSDLESIGGVGGGTYEVIEYRSVIQSDIRFSYNHPVAKHSGPVLILDHKKPSSPFSFMDRGGDEMQTQFCDSPQIVSYGELGHTDPETSSSLERIASEDKSPPLSTCKIYTEYFERVDRHLFAGDKAWRLDYSPFRMKMFDILELLSCSNNVTNAIYEINILFPKSPKQSAIHVGLWKPEWNVEIPDADCYRPEVYERYFWEDLFWWFIHRCYGNDRLQNTLFEFIKKVKETSLGSIQTDDGWAVPIFEITPSFPLCLDNSMKAYDVYCHENWGIIGERACLTASALYARLACNHMSTRAFVWGYSLLAEFAEDMDQLWKFGNRFLMVRANSLFIMLTYAGMELHKYVSDMKDKPIDAQINETPGHDFEISRLSTWLKWSTAINEHSLNASFQRPFRLCCIEIHHLMKRVHIKAQWAALRSK